MQYSRVPHGKVCKNATDWKSAAGRSAARDCPTMEYLQSSTFTANLAEQYCFSGSYVDATSIKIQRQ
jgi:hypothetical protein